MLKFTKKLATTLLAVIMVLVLIPATVSANDTITVSIDGQAVVFEDQQPVIIDSRTLVPVGGVFGALGFTPSWDSPAQTATLTRDDFTIVITIGSATFTTNGAQHTLDVPAQIINGRTMLPIRAVLESVGYELNWNSATRTVVITTSVVPTDVPTEVTEPTKVGTNVSTEFTLDEFLGHFDMDLIRAALDTDFTIGELNSKRGDGVYTYSVILHTEMMPNVVTFNYYIHRDRFYSEFIDWLREFGHLLDRDGRTSDGDQVDLVRFTNSFHTLAYDTQTGDVVLSITFLLCGEVFFQGIHVDRGNSIELLLSEGVNRDDIPEAISDDFRSHHVIRW